MKKTSLKYLQAHTDVENIITQLAPDIFGEKQAEYLSSVKDRRNKLLPAWLFVEAVEQTPIAISITDKDANILYANQSFCNVTGYSATEIIGQNQSFLSYKSTPSSVYYDLWNTITNNKVWEGRVLNRHREGHAYLANLTIVPIQDEMKNITHYLGMHRDISQEYQVEKKLSNQKHLIESVINASSVAMAVLDSHNKVILDNQQYKKLVSDLDHKEPAHFFLELLEVELGNLETYMEQHPHGFSNIELRVDSYLHNTAWFSCSGQFFQEKDINADSFFEDNSQNYLLLSISNITRQRKQQDEMYLQSLKVMLTEEEQIRSIREMLLGTIHQVSQPLNQIQAAIQLMKQKEESGALLDMLNQLKDSCQETVETLQYCVPEIAPTAITAINLNHILYEVLTLSNKRFLGNGIIIDWKPYTVLPSILGADNKLRMMFKQLIDNAITAVNTSKTDDRSIKIETFTNNDRVLVSITDSGPGIPAEDRNRVFQPFFTTQKAGSIGSGMGLVMAKEIVHQYDGTIEIDPDYKYGCRFIVSFPAINNSDHDRYDK